MRFGGEPVIDDPPLLHVHIPKTGGTTLYQALEVAIGREHCWQIVSEDISPDSVARGADGKRIVAGHLTWAVIEAFPRRPRVLTVLRDPVERAFSVYAYLRANVDSGLFDHRAAPGARQAASRSMSDLILAPDSALRSVLGPVQLGYLCGLTRDLRLNEAVLMPDGDLDMRAVERALPLALEHLEQCWWVGTTETLDRDMARLWRRLGWPPLARVESFNASANRPTRSDLTAAARKEVDRLTAADYSLYERARTLAHEQEPYHHAETA